MSYRRLTGALFLWALVPMPFLYVILPPFWLAAAAAAAAAVWRPQATLRLPPWLLNVLAVCILVVVALTGGLRVGPVRPLGHLLLLLTAVSSVSVHDRRSFLRTVPAIFLLWLVAVAASTHVMLVLYLIVSVVGWWWAGMGLLLVGLDPDRRWTRKDLPRLRHVLTATMVVVLIAVPIFLAMPRLNSPWVAGRSVQRSSGFSTSVELSRRGSITDSKELAVILTAAGGEKILERWTRLRGTAFNMVFAGSWAPRLADDTTAVAPSGLVWLAGGPEDLSRLVELSVELLRPRGYLFVPEGAVAVSAPLPVLVDPAGGLKLDEQASGPLNYTVWVGNRPTPRFDPPEGRDTFLPKRNSEVRGIAMEVGGRLGGAQPRAAAVERYLQSSFEYSLDTSGVERHDPVAWFLLEGRQGHCEFFAGAMVVLLRHLGIPARLVAGYNGGVLAPSGESVVVRQSNAHAWVEVWLGESSGWVTFDPTPASGVPDLVGQTGIERLRWMWQRVQDSWDRYVLTFGLSEQTGLLSRAADLLAALRAAMGWRHLLLVVVFGWGLWMLGRAVRSRGRPWWQARKRRSPAARVVEQLAGRLRADGVQIPPRATVRWIGATAGHRWPQTATAVGEIVVMAEQELYAAGGLDDSAGRSRRLWSLVRRQMAGGRERSSDDGKGWGL